MFQNYLIETTHAYLIKVLKWREKRERRQIIWIIRNNTNMKYHKSKRFRNYIYRIVVDYKHKYSIEKYLHEQICIFIPAKPTGRRSLETKYRNDLSKHRILEIDTIWQIILDHEDTINCIITEKINPNLLILHLKYYSIILSGASLQSEGYNILGRIIGVRCIREWTTQFVRVIIYTYISEKIQWSSLVE